VTRQFESTLARAGLVRQLTVELIYRVVDSQPELAVGDAVRQDQRLSAQLNEFLTATHALVEIEICDSKDIVVADSDSTRVGHPCSNYEAFNDVVKKTHWWDKLRVMTGRPRSFQVAEQMVSSDGKIPLLSVRLILYPALIYDDMKPAMRSHVETAFASILGAMLVGFIFSTLAFRPLGRLGRMLDLIAKGEYDVTLRGEPQNPTYADPFGAVASKLTLLGKQLQGAQLEFSDLRGNVERLLDELEDAVLIFGRDRRLIAAAGAVDRFLERSREEIIGMSLPDVFPLGTSLGLLLAQAIQTGRPLRNRRVPMTRAAPGNGSGPRTAAIALLTVEFLENSVQGGMLIRLRDPEATRMIGKHLQTADRLSAISQLTGGVAHEIKNPLNAMLMHVELTKVKLAHGDYDLHQQMEVISNEILRLDRVVKTFLDFTRPVKLNLGEVGLEEFVHKVADLARPQAEAAGITMTVEPPLEPVSITVDMDLLKQAVLNIVVNAIEAMGSRGVLGFACAIRGDDAELRISDTGPGIPPEVRDKIYNLYFTTKKGGTGIGLAMTYRIVQLHDGTIDVMSEPGKGTTFVLRFPAAVLRA
jgi:signal transduction histidine kinase